jgi:predicted RNA polymerase sigma factor
VLESGADALEQDYRPEDGQTNPFLHMGLHLAIREQVSTNRPAGIASVHRSLAAKLGDVHAAEHAMIECLGQALWQAQRSGLPPDEAAYLESLRRLA